MSTPNFLDIFDESNNVPQDNKIIKPFLSFLECHDWMKKQLFRNIISIKSESTICVDKADFDIMPLLDMLIVLFFFSIPHDHNTINAKINRNRPILAN